MKKSFCPALLIAVTFFVADAYAWGRGYRPALPGFGTPCNGALTSQCDVATGPRVAPTKKGLTVNGAPIAGISTSSVTVGTGTKVFTVDLSKGSYEAGDQIIIGSSADLTTQTMTGTVTSLVGTTLTTSMASATGNQTRTDWAVRQHLPSGWSTSGGSIRGQTGNAIGWDFRNITENIRLDGGSLVQFEDTIIDACGLTNQDINAPLVDNRIGSTFTMRYTKVDGCGYTGRLTMLVGTAAGGPGPALLEYSQLIRAPWDVFDPVGSSAVPAMVWRYNYLQSTCSTAKAFAAHVDVIQNQVTWTDSSVEAHNNVLAVECQGPDPSDVTGPLNFQITGAFAGDIYFHDNIFIGGGFSVATGAQNCPCSGTVRLLNNFSGNTTFQTDIFGNGGFLSPNSSVYPNLTINQVRSAVSNQAVNFKWNNAGVVTTVTSIP